MVILINYYGVERAGRAWQKVRCVERLYHLDEHAGHPGLLEPRLPRVLRLFESRGELDILRIDFAGWADDACEHLSGGAAGREDVGSLHSRFDSEESHHRVGPARLVERFVGGGTVG